MSYEGKINYNDLIEELETLLNYGYSLDEAIVYIKNKNPSVNEEQLKKLAYKEFTIFYDILVNTNKHLLLLAFLSLIIFSILFNSVVTISIFLVTLVYLTLMLDYSVIKGKISYKLSLFLFSLIILFTLIVSFSLKETNSLLFYIVILTIVALILNTVINKERNIKNLFKYFYIYFIIFLVYTLLYFFFTINIGFLVNLISGFNFIVVSLVTSFVITIFLALKYLNYVVDFKLKKFSVMFYLVIAILTSYQLLNTEKKFINAALDNSYFITNIGHKKELNIKDIISSDLLIKDCDPSFIANIYFKERGLTKNSSNLEIIKRLLKNELKKDLCYIDLSDFIYKNSVWDFFVISLLKNNKCYLEVESKLNYLINDRKSYILKYIDHFNKKDLINYYLNIKDINRYCEINRKE